MMKLGFIWVSETTLKGVVPISKKHLLRVLSSGNKNKTKSII